MKLCIAVIDDGVSKLTAPDLCFDLRLSDSAVHTNLDAVNPYSHGSICAAIIKKYAPQAKIGSIEILKNTGCGTLASLLSALKWCAENGIKLIHLSAGSIQPCDILPLRDMINQVFEKGCVVVAACKNGRNVSFPASFHNVIGVKADERITDSRFRANSYPNGGIELSCGATHEVTLIPQSSPYRTPFYNSFAAPVITAHVYHMLQNTRCALTAEKIRRELCSGANTSRFANVNPYNASWFANHQYTDKRPVVVFVGERLRESSRVIARMFLQDNIFPLLFTRFQNGYSYDCYLMDGVSSLQNACQGMAEFCGAELILANAREDELEALEADAIISYGVTFGGATNEEALRLDANKLSLHCIYENLLGFLVEE